MTIESFAQDVKNKRGKSGGWPADLTYEAARRADYIEITVSNANSAKTDFWKRIDPWGIAFFDKVRKNAEGKPLRLTFSVPTSGAPPDKFQYEALKRRLSYLVHAKDCLKQTTLLRGGSADKLYSLDELTNRPNREVIHAEFRDRSDTDKSDRLEKDFQSYLFGKGRNPDSKVNVRSNDRLALFGYDFVRLPKGRYKIEREFPTGVFIEKVEESRRLMPTEFIDLVTLNKEEDLALIEIKLNDSKLEVIPQILNYSLFFHSYRSKLAAILKERIDCPPRAKLVTYLVSNVFHPKFETVWSYYSQGELTMKQVVLGHMP